MKHQQELLAHVAHGRLGYDEQYGSTEASRGADTIDINWGWQFHRGDIKGISQPSENNIQNPQSLG